MTTLSHDYDELPRALRGYLGAHWRLFLFEGITLVILGILAISAPMIAPLQSISTLAGCFCLQALQASLPCSQCQISQVFC